VAALDERPLSRNQSFTISRVTDRIESRAPNDALAQPMTACGADSTGQRNGFIELLCWRLVAKRLPWALIQLSSHGVELGL